MPEAVVIGGGIGGLTSAIALRRQGWDVTVLERAPKIDPVGSGLAIAANGIGETSTQTAAIVTPQLEIGGAANARFTHP